MIDYLEVVLAGFRAALGMGTEPLGAPEEAGAQAWDCPGGPEGAGIRSQGWPGGIWRSAGRGLSGSAGGRRYETALGAAALRAYGNGPGEGPEALPGVAAFPLLGEPDRLERAAGSGNGAVTPERSPVLWDERDGTARTGVAPLSGARLTAAYPNAAETVGESWTLAGGALGDGELPVGELQWAERADRAFRRDSRRYDGGFYLY